MSDVFQRAHARIPCDRSVEVFQGALAGRRLGEGRFLDASLSGAYLRFDGELQPATPYRARLEGLDGPLVLPFRVVRAGPHGGKKNPAARHYGLVFNLTADREREWRRFLDVLRRQPPTGEEERLDRSLRDYWSI